MKTIKQTQKLKRGKRIFLMPDDEASLVYNSIKKELIGKYNISTESRDSIIKGLISELTHGDYNRFNLPNINLFILRTDIKNFFPSVNKHKLYQKLNSSNVLSDRSFRIIKEGIFTNKIEGIPLGLQFSNHLAELYLERFDTQIKETLKPIAYFRYVDDILLIDYDFSKDKKEQKSLELNYLTQVDNIFKNYDLTMNIDKTQFTFINNNNLKSNFNFNYLGYNFKSYNSHLLINIAEEKEKKIINKARKYIYYFKKSSKSNSDFWILYYQLKNLLFGVISHDRYGNFFKFGMGYNYRYVNDNDSILKILETIKLSIYSCRLSSYQKHTLLNLIEYDKVHGQPMDVLKKRFNYLRLNTKQQKLIRKRLGIPQFSAKTSFSSKMFFYLYKANKP